MDKTFKGGSVLWISLSLICLLCAVTLLFFMFQEKAGRIETEERLASVEKAKRTVEIKLDHAQVEAIQLKEQAEEDKRRAQAALAQLEGKDLNIKELETSLANEKRQRTSLANSLAQLRETYDSLEDRLEEARLKVENLKAQMGGYAGSSGSRGVELKRIVVKPKKQLEGKVLVINREFHFVVIDLGKQDKVGLGDELSVYQQAKEIGKIQVEKVYDTMSTAIILPGSQEDAIFEDAVVKSF